MNRFFFFFFGFMLLACATSSSSGDASDGGLVNAGPGAGGAGGADGSSGDGSSSGISWSAACSSFASDYCGRWPACSSYQLSVIDGDEAKCRARAEANCIAKHDAPSIGVTPDQVAACGRAWKATTCGALVNRVRPAACRIAGAVATGGSCASDDDCKSTKCWPDANGCGQCIDLIPLHGTCPTATTGACEDGAVCDGAPGAKTCVPIAGLVTEGGPCGILGDCGPHLYCTGPLNARVCVKARQLGESCSNSDPACDQDTGLWCLNNVCAQETVLQPGQGDCAAHGPLPTYCVDASRCETIAGGNVCVAPVADGATCGASGAFCLPYADCVSGTCKIVKGSECRR